ncbi:MAG: hypothetical protein K2G63_00905 [Oscillospiraceae bacterium]|nr:hypothetical protein [Oscillospiraceae bacterium]
MERKNNILYYFPVQADILYKNINNIKSREFKNAKKDISVPLTNAIISGYGIEDDNIKKCHIIYRKLLKITLFFAFVLFAFLIVIVLSDKSSGGLEESLEKILAWLIIPAFLEFPFLIVTSICLVKFKHKFLNYYLESYKPRCTQYPDDFRDRLAKTGFEMFNNYEKIKGFEDADEIDNLEKNLNTYYENCVCISCKRHIKCSKISQFKDYSAICPECGKISIIPENSHNNIDNVFLSVLNEYWFGENI